MENLKIKTTESGNISIRQWLDGLESCLVRFSWNFLGFLGLNNEFKPNPTQIPPHQQIDPERQQTQGQLQESQHFIQQITESNPNIIYIYDLIEQCNVYANRNIAVVLGYTKEEIQAMGTKVLPTLMHPDDFSQLPHHHQNIEKGADGEFFEIEYRMKHQDGTWYWFSSRELILARTPDGKPKQILGTATDITQLKQKTEALANHARKLALKSDIELALTQSRDLSTMLTACTEAIVKHLGVAFARIWELNSEENILELRASSGLYTHINGNHAQIPVGQFKIGLIASEKKPHLTNDIINDPRLNNPQWAKQEGMVAFAGYPLLVEDEVVGVMAMFARYSLSEETLNDLALISHDIAVGIERKRASIALQISQQRLQLALEGSNLGLWDWNLRTQEIYFDPYWKKMLGYNIEEIGNTFADWERLIHPEDLPKIQAYINPELKGEDARYEVEFRMKHKNGNWHWFVSNGKVFEWDEQGNPVRITGTHKDITKRKLEEVELQQFRLAVESTSDAIGMTNLEGIHYYQNQAFTEFYEYATAEEFNAAGGVSVVFTDQNLAQEVLTTIKVGQAWVGEVEHISRSGKKMQVLLRANPIKDGNGNIVGLVGISTDISDVYNELRLRKKAEEALRESEARERLKSAELQKTLNQLKNAQAQLIQQEKMAGLGQLVAGIAHEINNPINFIFGNIIPASGYTADLLQLIDLYQQHYPHPPAPITEALAEFDLGFIQDDFPKLLDSMKEGASRIKDIVLSLRNFSRFDEAEIKEADLHSGINSTLMMLQHRLREKPNHKKIQVIQDYGKLPLVECCPSQLNQVFMNLLTNAIDAIDEQLKQNLELIPEIKIKTELKVDAQNESKVVIKISDNGTGIPAEIQDQIFNPFFTTKPVGSGTGLGLSVSYQIIVEKHKGMLTFQSELGKGTEFTITIPIQK